MTKNETSRASPNLTLAPQPAGATLGSPFRPGQPSAYAALNSPAQRNQYTLQFLIAAIKKPSSHSAATNTVKVR